MHVQCLPVTFPLYMEIIIYMTSVCKWRSNARTGPLQVKSTPPWAHLWLNKQVYSLFIYLHAQLANSLMQKSVRSQCISDILVAGPVKRRFQKWTCAGLWSRVFANRNYVKLTRIQSGVVRSNYRWSFKMHFNPKGELTDHQKRHFSARSEQLPN